MKIVISESTNYSLNALEVLNSLGNVVLADTALGTFPELIYDADVLIVRLRLHLDTMLLKQAPQLKFIVSPTTGLNHIDINAAKERGISILSLKGEQEFLANVTATAELAWGLLLSLARNIPAAQSHVCAGGWDRDAFRGIELKNKTLGIVGFGRLGSMMAQYGHAFRMNVVAYDPYVHTYPDDVTPCDLHALLGQSNVVSVHAPYSQETVGMFDADAFSRMQDDALLINTSRGELIDEQALAEAIASGKLAGAGLDVLNSEADTFPAGLTQSPLHKLAKTTDRVIITPHLGGATIESMHDTELFMARKLAAVLGSDRYNWHEDTLRC